MILLRSAVAAALVVGVLAVEAHSAVTCETAVRRGQLDPLGRELGNSFRNELAVNGSGDVLFVGKAKGGKRALFFYPDVGTSEIIAERSGLAPSGHAYGDVSKPSLNDAGDLAFRARLSARSEGIFYRDTGESLITAAVTTDPSPAGGTFLKFPSISRVTSGEQIAFVSEVFGGPNGVFLWTDPDLALPINPLAVAGNLDLDGKPYCAFQSVGAEDDTVAWIATNDATSCTTPTGPGQSVYVFDGNTGPAIIGRVGDATPIGGTTYTEFLDAPQVNALDHVLFHASFTGARSGTGLFLYDGVTVSNVVASGDGAPDVGGVLSKIRQFSMADADQAFVRSTVRSGTARFGLFRFDGTPEALVSNLTPVPTDAYGAGAVIKSGLYYASAPGAGTKIAVLAKIKDTVAPKTKTGILRCDAP